MTVTILTTAPHLGDPWQLPLVPAVRSPGEAVHAANDKLTSRYPPGVRYPTAGFIPLPGMAA